MRATPVSLLSLMLVTGCFTDLFAQGDALVPDSETYETSSTSSGEASTPTTSAGTEVQTVTGEVDTGTTAEPGSSTGAPVNVPPEIVVFDGIPDHISEAGPVELNLVASVDVTTVQLFLDGVQIGIDLKPKQFPWTHEFLSAKDNGPARLFKVVVEDGEGLSAEATATVAALLPASGAEKCIFEDPERGAVISGVSALRYTAAAIYAVGSRDAGAGPRLTVWKLGVDSCALQDGWPRTLANWSVDLTLPKLFSLGSAVDVDADGNVVVAGNFINGDKRRSYVALLNAGGSLLWEHAGQTGDEVTGVAVGQVPDHVFVVGAQRVSDDPVSTDGAIWVYRTKNNQVVVPPPLLLKAPFTEDEPAKDPDNLLIERVRGVVLEPGSGHALAVGERVFIAGPNIEVNRAFTARVDPLGEIVSTWTSPAAMWFPNDAMHAVAVCGDGFVAGGWTRDDIIGALPQPMTFWIDGDGTSALQRPEPLLAPTTTDGVACDREGKIVSAGKRTAGEVDAQVFMIDGPESARVTYDAGVPGDDGATAAACDPRGFCGWGGFRSEDAKPYAVVRVHHP
jgi:hypothetical protein